MTKVLGCKVSDDFYRKFADLPDSININLRQAAENYLEMIENISVNSVNSLDERECFNCKYRELCKIIDKHLERLEDGG